MLEVPIYNVDGKQVETLQVDERRFGGRVNVALLKQAVVAYHANRRQGASKTKTRGEVNGTTKKMYRQKGTGNARHGAKTAPIFRGGGHTFAKGKASFRKQLPRKMRRAALRSAILAKMLGNDLAVVDGLAVDAPKTKVMATLLKNLSIQRTCILALAGRDANIHLSSRNIPDLTVRTAEELNAFDVATRQKMLVTREAMKQLCGEEAGE
jgi:large subunit ribosomal protein L4